LDIAIAEVETKFKNQLGDFRSEVADTAITDGTMKAAITPLNLQIKRLKGLIFNAPIDLEKENERPFFTLDERVKYLEIELGELKKGQRDRVTAIADLLSKTEFESAKDEIWSELTRLDSSVAMVGNYYAFTGNEEFFNEQEKDSHDNASVTLQTDIQEEMPISLIKEPEIVVNPLIAGLTVNQEPETLPILDAIAVSTDDLPTDDKPQRELLKGQTHAQVATITRLKLATIRSYPSKNNPAKGRSRTFQFNKETRLWDEI